ncbi:MAG: 16S rRNA methyltransferase [Ferroplasma sp.]
MLRIIIADAELQLIPKVMWRDQAIKKIALKNHKETAEIILDSNYMHTSIEKYFPGESTRLGRPDIIYLFLQMAMESILNKSHKMEIYIHTRDNYIISINPDTNLPRSYNRFIGLFEDLYKKKSIEFNGNTLLSIKEGSLIDLVKAMDGYTFALSPHGKDSTMSEIISQNNINVIIGGFSQGDYLSDVYSNFEAMKIFGSELTIWSVGMEIIAQYERFIHIIK